MDRSTLVRTGLAGTVAGLGMAVGGIAMATAADDTATNDGTSERGFVVHARAAMDGQLAEDLADQLGLDAAKVEDALEAVHDELRPEVREFTEGERPEFPTEEEMEARRDAFEKALAQELGVSQDKVAAAFEALRAEVESAHRDDLVDRLDAAVDDGTLTESDKASVLKAYDADVIGGFGMGGFGHGPGGPRP